MVVHLRPDKLESKTHRRNFIRAEIFNRLELTHTCIDISDNEIRTFAEDEQIEIEEEEEELYEQLEELLEEYDNLMLSSAEPVHGFNHKFLENLDHFLRPVQGTDLLPRQWVNETDLLSTGCEYSDGMNSRGEWIRIGYREKGGEGNMLSLLFG